LGDTAYDMFCQAGIDWDNRLAELGATRVLDRTDCDVDFEEPAESWISDHSAWPKAHPPRPLLIPFPVTQKTAIHPQNPFPAKMLVNRLITAESSSKETRHYEISITGSA
jgi:sulfite reductase (NADPH) flavoprotein alpha-component